MKLARLVDLDGEGGWLGWMPCGVVIDARK